MNANRSAASKPIYRSKTFWLNVVAATAALYPPVGAFLAENPELAALVITGANVLLRLVTQDRVSLFSDESAKRPGSGALLLLLLVAGMCAGVLGGLTSCKATNSESFLPPGFRAVVTADDGAQMSYSAKGITITIPKPANQTLSRPSAEK